MVLTRLKHIDDIRKSAKERAQRRWKNYAVEKEFKAARQEAANAPKQPKELSPANILEQDKLIKEATTKFESKFIKDIMTMLEGHKKHNQQRHLLLYAMSIRVRHKRLSMEKLRRLEAREAERAALQSHTPKSDLFA